MSKLHHHTTMIHTIYVHSYSQVQQTCNKTLVDKSLCTSQSGTQLTEVYVRGRNVLQSVAIDSCSAVLYMLIKINSLAISMQQRAPMIPAIDMYTAT